MSEYEGKRLKIFENYIENLSEEITLSHGDFVFPSFAQTVAVDDGYREADMVIEITIADELDKNLVLMSSKIENGDRQLVDDVEDEEALKRARKYAADVENGAYYGLINDKEVYVIALDPDLRLQEKKSIEELPQLIEDIIKEERRIKDSEEFVTNLKEYHEDLEPRIGAILRQKLESDKDFEGRVRKFLVPIGQSYEEDEKIPAETLDMLSMQATYLLIDKILFYYLIIENENNLRQSLEGEEYEEIFNELKEEPPSPEDLNEAWSQEFWDYLNEIFNLIQKINYAPVFDPRTSPLNEITLEKDPTACYIVKELMNYLYGKEALSNLFDGPLLAKIYEGLIPPDLRWKWGQIYTPPEVTRLITEWAIRNPDDEVLDPACGTGRFLISAYERLADLKGVSPGEKHQEILSQIHGIDINQFPAHLATMSLVAMNLGSFTEQVNIHVRDFFRFKGKGQTDFSPKESMVELTGQTHLNKEGSLGGQSKIAFGTSVDMVDAIVMNPPYSRQEALGEEYKSFVRDESLSNLKDRGKIKMGKRAGFYVYFMIHGTKFLKENGRFGMIAQNSWLDVDYGKDLQKFLLDNYKIKAIIGPQRDRFIKTASVNTVLVLLEKENDKQKRDENKIKFVQLKKNLKWFEQNYGFEELLNIVEENEKYMGNDLRVISKTQKELREKDEGKWNKYIRAPDIYFKIFEKASNKLLPLNEVCKTRFGIKTGANEFFYLPKPGETNKFFKAEFADETGELLLFVKDGKTKNKFEKQGFDIKEPIFRIEKEYWMHKDERSRKHLENVFETLYETNGEIWVPNYVVKNPREVKGTSIDPKDLSYVVLMVHEPKNELREGVKSYIEWGESWRPAGGNRYPKRPTCASRKRWYDLLDMKPADIVFPERIWESHSIPINVPRVLENKNLYGIIGDKSYSVAMFLNSSIGRLFLEVEGRSSLGQGILDIDVQMVSNIHVVNREVNLDALPEIGKEGIFEEIGANTPEEVSLEKVKKDRRKLDKFIMEDILHLSKKEQLEIYRGVVDIVRNRIIKGQKS